MTMRLLADGILENYTGPGLGWIGGGVFTAIAVVTILLARNMNSRIKRLPADFDEQPMTESTTPGSTSPREGVSSDGVSGDGVADNSDLSDS
ncbi:MAG TPA: hypothetical protein DCM51_04460 [Actinobacteria bacterium]|nr:hypothetical protein [Actinomycetota bacterium]